MRCLGFPLLAMLCFSLACGESSGMREGSLNARSDSDGEPDDAGLADEDLDANDGTRGDGGTRGEGQGATDSQDREGDARGATGALDDAGLEGDDAAHDSAEPGSDVEPIRVDDPAGACANAADLERIEGYTVAELACEGAACAARALQLSFPLSIDADALQTCVDADAPTLADLSAACRACFVAIAQCVPTSCVSAFGGQAACTQAPSTSFAACTDVEPATGACAECEASQCRTAFVDCSGLAP